MKQGIYQVVSHKSIETLTEIVNQFYKEGWIVNGGISYDPRSDCYLQSMVNYIEVVPEVVESRTEEVVEVVISDPFANEPSREMDQELWEAIKQLPSTVMFAVTTSNIYTVKELIASLNDHRFREKAGTEVMTQLADLIKEKGW